MNHIGIPQAELKERMSKCELKPYKERPRDTILFLHPDEILERTLNQLRAFELQQSNKSEVQDKTEHQVGTEK